MSLTLQKEMILSVYVNSEPIVDMPLGAHPPKENNAKAHNGNSLTSNQVVPSGKLDQPLW